MTSVIGWLLTTATEAVPAISQLTATDVSVQPPVEIAFSPRPLSSKPLFGGARGLPVTGFKVSAVGVANALLKPVAVKVLPFAAKLSPLAHTFPERLTDNELSDFRQL